MKKTATEARTEAKASGGSDTPAEAATLPGDAARPAGEAMRRFVTLEYFYKDMLGMTRGWFYRHLDDEGFPQRVYIGDKPVLVLEECFAYIDHQMEDREPPPSRKRRA